MVIMGVGDGPDAGASLIVDNQLVAVATQARHDQVPRSRAFPWLAIEECLEQSGIRSRDVDLVAVAGRFSPPFFLRRHPGLRRVARNAFSAARDTQVFFQAMLRQSGLGAFEADRASEWLEQRFRARGFLPQRVILIDIHTCLAHAAYRTQPDDEALIISLHPMGDGVALAVHRGAAGQVDLLWSQKGFASLHVHVDRCVAAMGLEPLLDEQRMWALAGRGEPDADLVSQLQRHLHADGPRLSRRSYPIPTNRRVPVYRSLSQADPDVAASSVYANLRETVCALVEHHVREHGIGVLALSGAIFDNPRLCEAVSHVDGVERVHVNPDPGWSALALGAAAFEAGMAPEPFPTHGLGRSYDARQCERALRVAGISVPEAADPAMNAADVLAQSKGLARFSGRAGVGRFAQGTRTVLVRADEPDAVERVRTALGRPDDEEPGCLWLDAPGHGTIEGSSRLGALYGSVAPHVDAVFAERYPGVVTADGRAHVVRVDPDGDPELYRMLRRLGELTGCHAVAAFPLARDRDPVVAVPGDAVRVWRSSEGVGGLLLGPYVVQ